MIREGTYGWCLCRCVKNPHVSTVITGATKEHQVRLLVGCMSELHSVVALLRFLLGQPA